MSTPYQRSDAIRDGIIADLHSNLAQIVSGTWTGNCPSCLGVGLFPHRCGHCQKNIVLYVTARGDLISPYWVARMARPQGSALQCLLALRSDLQFPLTPPLETKEWLIMRSTVSRQAMAWITRPGTPALLHIHALAAGDWHGFSYGNGHMPLLALAAPPSAAPPPAPWWAAPTG